jgi:hypothetical protein
MLLIVELEALVDNTEEATLSPAERIKPIITRTTAISTSVNPRLHVFCCSSSIFLFTIVGNIFKSINNFDYILFITGQKGAIFFTWQSHEKYL